MDRNAHVAQLVSGFEWKWILATLGTIIVDYFSGDIALLYMYMGILFADFVAGTLLACSRKEFSPYKLYGWVRKFITHMEAILLFCVVQHAGYRAFGLDVSAINFILFILISTESVSIYNKMNAMGMPLPKIFVVLPELINEMAARKLGNLIGGEDGAKAMVKAVKEDEQCRTPKE